jgi:uncharacterized protein YyaL (SSP411 family)
VVTEGEGHDALCAAVLAKLGPDDLLLRSRPGAAPAGVDESWFAGRSAQRGRAAAYICRGTRCSLPITDAAALAEVSEFHGAESAFDNTTSATVREP